MSNMQARAEIKAASIERMKSLSFGDPVTNICAGENNPRRHSFFVAYKVNSRKNRWGITHREHSVNCTDKKGKFWDACVDTTHPGHLDAETCARLFEPVWQAEYGTIKTEIGGTS